MLQVSIFTFQEKTVSFLGSISVEFSCQKHPRLVFRAGIPLKVPKCEIFDRSDFHDFYSIKPFLVGDFGAKI